ncbi:MAG TPA: acyl-CoA dehydrogenase family protein [Candidatus Limnocylindria bacterium]
MSTSNFFTGNPDLVEVFDKVIPWDRVVAAVEGPGADVAGTVSTWREVLDLAGRYIATEIAPRAAKVDEIGVIRENGQVRMNEPMTENLRGLAELGLASPSVPVDFGGAGLPFTVVMMIGEMLARADLATQVQHGIGWNSPAALIYRFGTEEQKARYLPPLAKGEIMGAVAMTEPQAGSDVGRLTTTATPRQDGCWILQGRKQFISAGQGDMVIVLARAPGSSGLDGLGMFIADREGDNYIVERAEHKFVIRASPTCALLFEGTRATPLGKPGEGWKQILTFMNESRLGVGIQGIGVATAALDKASEYAKQRVQMGKPIREHPMVAEMLLDMETTVTGARALAYTAAVLQDLVLFGHDEQAARDLRELTPLVKWYGTEGAVRVCRLALQVHGGVGVVDEYDVGRFMRDALITPIYEGTSQIQSLMAVKDLMKATMQRPRSLLGRGPSRLLADASFDGRVGSDFAAARGHIVGVLRSLMGRLVRRKGPGILRGAPLADEDLGPILLHAERITEALAHTHVARVLAERARGIPERQQVAERAARTARLVAERNRRAISLDDGSVFERIATWRSERS